MNILINSVTSADIVIGRVSVWDLVFMVYWRCLWK